jgi:outer membrane protein TolC
MRETTAGAGGGARDRIGRIRLAACLAAALAAPAFAQAPPPKVEFDEAIRRALDQNPTVAEAAANIRRAEAIVRQARSVTQPFVAVSLTNTTIDDARGFDGGVTQPRNQSAFSASAGMEVLSMARWAAIDQARDQVEVANRSTADVRQQIAVAAASAYLAVIAARRQIEVDERALENARAHLDYAQKRLEGGAGSRLNQLRAAQEFQTDQARVEVTRLALRAAQEALGVVLAADGPVDAGAEPTFESATPGTEDEWTAVRTDLQFQASVRRAAERVVRDSWKDWVPTAAVQFDPVYLTPSGLFQPSRTWRLSMTLTHSLFEGGQRRAAERLREAARDQASLAFAGLQIQARSEVRLSQEAVAALERALVGARQSAGHAAEVLKITTAAFEVGATTNIEVIDAQRRARDADTAVAVAEDNVRQARLALLNALGRFP